MRGQYANKKRADNREGMMVTTMVIHKTLHRRLALAAVEDNAAITVLVRQALTEWLDRRDQRKRKKEH